MPMHRSGARRSRHLAMQLLVIALPAGACTSVPSAPKACQDDSGCPLDAHCRQGVCVADAPPTANVAGPASALTHAEVLFDGSGSTDPDDDLEAFTWSVRMHSSSCAPDLGVSSGRTFRPLFPCAGDFDVILVVKDATGDASVPAIVPVTIADRAGVPPTVTAGPELTLAHRCVGAPPTCAVLAPDGTASFQLSAGAVPQQGGSVRYRWNWSPPPDAGGSPEILFAGGADVASPVVSMRSAGGALSGRWTFVVTATDVNGLSARAEQPVLVQNQAPVVSGGGAVTAVAAYDAATGRYRAAGMLSFSCSDPDGDAVKTTWRFASTVPDHCTFGSAATGDGSFELTCADPAELANGAVRTITLQATDTSGAASAIATWTVTVTPPAR